MKTRHSTLYAISGIIWLGVGIMLLNLGLGFLMQGFQGQSFVTNGYSSLFFWVSSFTNGYDTTAMLFIAFALILGFAKGRFVMQKAALKSHDRITKLENPTTIGNLYNKSNYIILAVMMGLGMLMKALNLSNDIRGFIDVAVGSALMQGSLAYFRLMIQPAKRETL